jgi:PAS domain S-box-containing protein
MKEFFQNLTAWMNRSLEVDSADPETQRRGGLLMRILAILLVAALLMTAINAWLWWRGSMHDRNYIQQDLVFVAALVTILVFTRRTQRVSLAAHILLVGYIAFSFLFLDVTDSGRSLLVFTVPIVLSGLVIKPWYAFLYAGVILASWILLTSWKGTFGAGFLYILNGVTFLTISLATYVTAAHLNRITRQIRDSEEKYHGIFDNVPIGLYRTTRDGHILDVNPAFLKMFGHSELRSMQHRNAADLYADSASRMEHLESLSDSGVHVSELNMRDASGRTFWVMDYVRQVRDKTGQVKWYEGSLIDVTARRMAEDSALETLARLEALVGNIPQGVLFEDDYRRIQFANATFCNLFGIPSVGTILGADCGQLAQQASEYFSDPEGFLQSIGDHLAGKGITLSEELPLRDGRTLERDYIPIFMAGNYVGSYWLYRNVTGRKRADEALRRSEERYHGLFKGMAAGFALHEIICNEAGDPVDYRFLDVNPEFERLTGLTRETLIGHRVLEALPGTETVWIEMYGKVALTGEPAHFEQYTASFDKYFEVTAFSPRRGQFAATIFDVTEKVRAQKRIREQVERLAALRTIDSVITASTDLSLSLNAILDQTSIHLRVDAADILLLNPVLNILEYAAGKGFRARSSARAQVRLGDGYAGRSALTRSLIHIPNLKTAAPPFERASLLMEEKFIGYHVVPLIAKGNVVGVLEAFHRTDVSRDRDWLDFLEALAAQAAIGIDNSTLFENLQRSHMDLSMAYEVTLEGWIAALDLRDQEAEGHTRRVTELTQRIAACMGIQGNDLVNVRRGALLHDIGKMGVPDHILFKTEELNEEEWGIMRSHPQVAYNLLHPITYLRGALDIPYCHHENWDGSGYPRGLKGGAIPLAARIFAVVDMYDTLIAECSSRPAWSPIEALDHIRGLSGSHFDPQVVAIFLREIEKRDHAD